MFTMYDCALSDLEINIEILSDGWKWLIKSWVVRCSCEVETDYYAIRTKSLRQEINRERGFHWWNHQSLNIALVSNFSCHRRDSSQYLEMILKILRGDFLLVQKLQCFTKCQKKNSTDLGVLELGKFYFANWFQFFPTFGEISVLGISWWLSVCRQRQQQRNPLPSVKTDSCQDKSRLPRDRFYSITSPQL